MDKCSDGSPRRKRCRENNNSTATLLEQLEREINDESSENDNSMNGDHLTNTVPPGDFGDCRSCPVPSIPIKGD